MQIQNIIDFYLPSPCLSLSLFFFSFFSFLMIFLRNSSVYFNLSVLFLCICTVSCTCVWLRKWEKKPIIFQYIFICFLCRVNGEEQTDFSFNLLLLFFSLLFFFFYVIEC